MSVTESCRDIKELNLIAQKAYNLFLGECKKQSIDIFITETYRSQERQNYLYAQGRTRSGQIVTWTLKSNHTGRMAWDIACTPKASVALYDANTLKRAGEIAKQLGITWGGTWKTPDRPHFEITIDWKEPKKEDDEMVEASKIIVDGKEISIKRILKEGSSYVSVRDLANALGYEIGNQGSTAVLNKK